MRLGLLLLGFAAVLSTAALGEDDCRCWTPDAQQVAIVDATIASRPLPLGSLDRYVRYYAGTISHDSRFIRGKLVPANGDEVPGVHIVEGRMPLLQGDGCVTNSVPGSGTWVYLSCARPGAWTPNDGQIAELEALLPDAFRLEPLSPRGAVFLQDYARHYAGVTEGDNRIVVGSFVIPAWIDETAGIYIGSEAELPQITDGGCGVITVRFDPSSKQIWWECNADA